MCRSRLIDVRYLTLRDTDALLLLEQKKWSTEQAASRELLCERIELMPRLSIGAFCVETGQALASLFMTPFDEQCLRFPLKWSRCADLRKWVDIRSEALFGLSFTSVRPDAGDAIFEFFWPKAIKAGWKRIYLGSPVPGFAKARTYAPDLDIEQYMWSVTNSTDQMPLDPQLRYYYKRGFKEIVRVEEKYFPHPASLDYGVILRGYVPMSGCCKLLSKLPEPVLRWLAGRF